MISVWYNLSSDLTLSQISSDKKILSTVEKIFGNTLFTALDIWSVRLQIPPNAFVSLRFNGCMYQQFFRKVLKGNFAIRWETVFMYDDKQCCWNSFSSSIYQLHLTQQTCFCSCAYVKRFQEFEIFIINIYQQKFSCRYFCFSSHSGDYTNILIW